MSSNMKAFLKGTRTAHTVGLLTGFLAPRLFPNGATVAETGGVDVFRLVELVYDADGNATCKYATAAAKKGNVFLHVTPQNVLESYGELRSDFYVAKDEMANLAVIENGMLFQTSAVKSEATVKKGAFVIWSATNKQFEVKATPAAGDGYVFQITDIEDEESYTIDAAKLVELRFVEYKEAAASAG